MSLFGSPLTYLGVDFDSHGVKVVELKNEGGRPRLVTYGFLDLKVSGEPTELTNETTGEVAKLIRSVCSKARVSGTKAITALPSFSIFSSILTLPVMAKKDLPSAVKWEAKKVIPLPIDDMILDWRVLEEGKAGPDASAPANAESTGAGAAMPTVAVGQRGFLKIATPTKGRYSKILLTAAPKDLVKRYIDTFRTAGLNLLSIDTESFALIRSLVGNDKSAVMLVDLGSAVTTISVVSGGVPVFSRSLDVGGLSMTKAIASRLGSSLERAEQFKYDIGMDPERVGQGSVPKIIEETIAPIVDELKYSLNLYRNQGQQTIEKVIVTGGSSLLLNLPAYLANVLGLKVFLGDPWARVIYPQELKPVLDELGPRFAVAIGLAMRNIE